MEHHSHGSPSFINIAVLLLFAVVIAVASTAATYYFLGSKTNEQPQVIQPPVVPPVQTNNQTYLQPTISSTVQTATPSDETANWKVYRNEKYGFTLKLPPSWKNYKVWQIEGDFNAFDSSESFRFGLPTKSSKWPAYNGYGVLFTISVTTPQEWEKEVIIQSKEGEPGSTPPLYRNDEYVFHLTPGQDCAEDLCDRYSEINDIRKTFKLIR